jgi:hypothetical protein
MHATNSLLFIKHIKYKIGSSKRAVFIVFLLILYDRGLVLSNKKKYNKRTEAAAAIRDSCFMLKGDFNENYKSENCMKN